VIARVTIRLALIGALVAGCGTVTPLAAPSATTGVSTAVERGPSDFTGNFMTDQRPNWMGWLSLTQSGVTVSGSMINVVPDGKGTTKATANAVTGTTDGGSALSLTTGSFLGTTSVSFSGRRTGDQIALTYADGTGQLQTATYRAASQAAFNDALSAWQLELTIAKAASDKAAADKKARDDRNAALAQAVRDRSADLQSLITLLSNGTSNRKGQIADAASDIKGEQSDLAALQSDLATLQKDSREPLDQYSACVAVRYDYNTSMGYDFNTALAYDRNAFTKVAQTIDTNLSAVDQRVAETQQAARALAAAIAASPLVVTGVLRPGDEQATIDTYRATAASVATQLASLRTTDASTYTAAQNLMSQGLSIWNTVKANHGCS